jgi:hypothetical protein
MKLLWKNSILFSSLWKYYFFLRKNVAPVRHAR